MTDKLYLKNSYLKEANARLISKELKEGLYQVKLDRTIFYPHLSGGQPRDQGFIGAYEVLDVYEDGDDIIHLLEEDFIESNFKLKLDWEHRFDMMQQHTGQHVLSAAFHKAFNIETIGLHIGRDYVYIDLDCQSLSEKEASQAELLANKIVQSNFKIKSYFVSKKEYMALPMRKRPEVEGDIRIVEIEDVEYSACGGTHLRSTGELGLIKIIDWVNYKGHIRLKFIAGLRALEDYTWKNEQVNEIALIYSSKDRDILEKTEFYMERIKELEREARSLREQVFQYEADLFLKDSVARGDYRYLYKEFTDTSLKEINRIASNLNKEDSLVQLYRVFNGKSGQFLMARSNNVDLDLREVFSSLDKDLEARGGGSPQVVQGSVASENLDLVIEFLKDHIYKSLTSK